jgi:hypothetical protein
LFALGACFFRTSAFIASAPAPTEALRRGSAVLGSYSPGLDRCSPEYVREARSALPQGRCAFGRFAVASAFLAGALCHSLRVGRTNTRPCWSKSRDYHPNLDPFRVGLGPLWHRRVRHPCRPRWCRLRPVPAGGADRGRARLGASNLAHPIVLRLLRDPPCARPGACTPWPCRWPLRGLEPLDASQAPSLGWRGF